MLTPAIIVLALLVLGAGIVIWATRRKPDRPSTGPRETDTAWNDPVSRGDAARPPHEPRP
jgi:hypothetical protein